MNKYMHTTTDKTIHLRQKDIEVNKSGSSYDFNNEQAPCRLDSYKRP